MEEDDEGGTECSGEQGGAGEVEEGLGGQAIQGDAASLGEGPGAVQAAIGGCVVLALMVGAGGRRAGAMGGLLRQSDR
jgi:hypothetical protein